MGPMIHTRGNKTLVVVCVVIVSLLSLLMALSAQEATVEISDTKEGEAPVTESTTPPVEEEFYLPTTIMKPESIAGKSSETADLLSQEIFQRNVSLEVKNAELQDVVRLIAKKTGINIIMNDQVVKGRQVTVSLTEVPLGIALDVILKTNDLGYVLEPGNILRVVPRKMVQSRPVEVETKLFPINWVPAKQLKDTLEDFRSEHGEIREHADTNSLIITDTPPNIRVFEDIVKKLDQPQRQVMIESRIANIRVSALQEFGIDWTIVTQGNYYELSPLIDAATGLPSWAWVAKALAATDDGGDAALSGLIPGISAPSPQLANNGYKMENNARISKTDKGLEMRISKVADIFGEEIGVDATLRALEDRGEAVILANPRVVTLNNVPATIDILQDNPYFEAVEKEGGQIRYSVKFKESGTKLVVTPYITPNGYIRMKLVPEQKIIVERVDDFRGYVPVISTRKAETNVIVKDETTVCLGGLRQHNQVGSRGGVPWFINIPVIGWLFKNTSNDIDKDELVIFVTPHILKSPKINAKEQYQYDWIDNVWNLPDEFLEGHPVITDEFLDIEKQMYPNKITNERMGKTEEQGEE